MTSTVLLSGFVLMFTAIGIAVLPWSQTALDESSAAFAELGRLVRRAIAAPVPALVVDRAVQAPTAPMVVRVLAPADRAIVIRPRVSRALAQAS